MPAVETANMTPTARPRTSRSLVLFLSTSMVVLQHVGATTFSSDTTSSSCDATFSACIGDAVCSDCYYESQEGERFDQFIECLDNFPETSACGLSDPCCRDKVLPYDCLGNDAFVAHFMCNIDADTFFGPGECTTFTCEGLDAFTPAPATPDAAETISPEGDDSTHTTVDDTLSSVACYAEYGACYGDEVCLDCLTAAGDEEQSDQFLACLENFPFTGDVCLSMSMLPCCLDEASPHDCLANELFAGYHGCILNESASAYGEECTALTCDGPGGGGDDSSATAVTPAPTTPVGTDTSSARHTGAGTTPGPSTAALSTGSTSARDLDLTPSPTTEGEEESGTKPPTATTSSIVSDDVFSSSDPCQAQGQRCAEDDECPMCITLHGNFDLDAYNTCVGALSVPENACDFMSGLMCCVDYVASEVDCFANELAVEFWECAAEASCPAEELVRGSCDGEDGGAEVVGGVDGNGTVSFGASCSGRAVALAFLLSVAVALL